VQQLDVLKNNIFTYINNYLQRATRTGSDGILESSRSKLPLIDVLNLCGIGIILVRTVECILIGE